MRAVPILRLEAEVLSLYDPPMRAPATRYQMAQMFRELQELPGITKTSQLTPPTIAAWVKSHTDRSPARTASLLRCLRVICGWAEDWGYLRASPFARRKVTDWVRPDIGLDRQRAPCHRSEEEIRSVLRQADAEAATGSWKARRLQALVYLYAFTGARKEEALHLQAANVNLAARRLTIKPVVWRNANGHRREWRPKTVRSSAQLPIAEPLADVLARWMPHCGSEWLFPGRRLRSPWTSGMDGTKPLDCVKALAARAGVTGLTILAFRKTIGTRGKAWGLSQLEMKAVLRHTSVQTQEWYDEESVESLRGAMDKISRFYSSAM